MRHPFLSFTFVCLATALGVNACSASAKKSDTPIVLVSVLPQAYFVERLAGDWVDVVVMVPPGANPSTFEPTMAQLRAASQGMVYIKIGHQHFPFESTWLANLLESTPQLKAADGSTGIAMGEEDPHVWTSPRNAAVMAKNYAEALIEVIPEHEIAIRDNLTRLQEDIAALDAEISDLLGNGEGQDRKFLVLHPAWGYFADQYGLVQTAIEEDGKKPDPEALIEIIKTARADRIRVVFTQPQFTGRGAEVVASEIGATVIEIDPLAPDWAENLRRTARAIREAIDS